MFYRWIAGASASHPTTTVLCLCILPLLLAVLLIADVHTSNLVEASSQNSTAQWQESDAHTVSTSWVDTPRTWMATPHPLVHTPHSCVDTERFMETLRGRIRVLGNFGLQGLHWMPPEDVQKALQHFEILLNRSGSHSDLFAFHGGLSDDDEEVLRQEWYYTTADVNLMRERLPSMSVWTALKGSNMSIIANAPVGSGRGDEIDSFPEVCRFNNFASKNLGAEHNTGIRTTMHVVNAFVPIGWTATTFDLELRHPSCSWGRFTARKTCPSAAQQLHHAPPDVKLVLMRPTIAAYFEKHCNGKSFTRGFLFFWLIGRHARQVKLFGFGSLASSGGDGQCCNEGYHPFERFVWEELWKMYPDMFASPMQGISAR